jgi:hypothetical protein
MEVCKMIKITPMFPIIAALAVFAVTACKVEVIPSSSSALPKSIFVTAWDRSGAEYSNTTALMMLKHRGSLFNGAEIARGTARDALYPKDCWFDLKTPYSFVNDWTGSGEYVVMLLILNSSSDIQKLFCTYKKTAEEEADVVLENIQPFLINQKISTIPFDGFTEIPDAFWGADPPSP